MLFDGTNAPTMKVSIALSGGITSDLTSGALTWTDFPAQDVVSVSINRGTSTEFDSPSAAKCTIVLNNLSADYDQLKTSGPYYPNLTVGKPVQVAGVFGATTYARFRGWIDDINPTFDHSPTCTITAVDSLDLLSRAQIDALTTTDYFGEVVDNPAFDGDKTGTRIGRILDEAGRPATMRDLDTGFSECSATVYGDYALTLITQVVETELGWFFQSRTGVLTFKDRYAVLNDSTSTAVQATLSDVGTDVDMLTMDRRRGMNTVYNTATVTRSAPATPPAVPNLKLFPRGPVRFTQAREAVEKPQPQTYSDPTSITSYGIRSYPGSPGALLRADHYAWGMASWLVSRYKNPADITSRVEIDGGQLGASLWATILPLDLLYRIRLKRTYGKPTTVAHDKELLILGMDEQITSDSWHMAFNMIDPGRLVQYKFVLDSGTEGVLNSDQLGF